MNPPSDSHNGTDGEALTALREHLLELQLPQIACGRRAIVIFEGPTGAGKKAALRELAAAFDPCHYTVHCTQHERREAAEGHWLARFWRQLPSAGHTSIFFRSWYRRVLDDRIQGRTDDAALARAFDEINEFEAQQRDYGTLIVKLYFEVGAIVQDERVKRRMADPWARALVTEEPTSVATKDYEQALADLKANSDTRWSPWNFIDGNDEDAAAISALSTIADAWADAMPAEPTHLVKPPVRAA